MASILKSRVRIQNNCIRSDGYDKHNLKEQLKT